MVSITIPPTMRLTEKEWDRLWCAYQVTLEGRKQTQDLDEFLIDLAEEEARLECGSAMNGTTVEERSYIDDGLVIRSEVVDMVNEVCSSGSHEAEQSQCEEGSPVVPPARAVPRVYGSVEPPQVEFEGYAIEIPKEPLCDRITRFFKQTVLRCCFMGDVVAEWETERKFDRDVNKHMVLQTLPEINKTVIETVVAITHHVNERRVCKVPRLVAHVTVALRMKLGLGAMDASVKGNVSLVRAQAAKLMRDWGLRDKDASAHLYDVERCFFANDVHYRLTNWRSRAIAKSLIARMMFSKDEPPRFDF